VGVALGPEDLECFPLRLLPNTTFIASVEPFAFAIFI
jgi:hypothetical protein